MYGFVYSPPATVVCVAMCLLHTIASALCRVRWRTCSSFLLRVHYRGMREANRESESEDTSSGGSQDVTWQL